MTEPTKTTSSLSAEERAFYLSLVTKHSETRAESSSSAIFSLADIQTAFQQQDSISKKFFDKYSFQDIYSRARLFFKQHKLVEKIHNKAISLKENAFLILRLETIINLIENIKKANPGIPAIELSNKLDNLTNLASSTFEQISKINAVRKQLSIGGQKLIAKIASKQFKINDEQLILPKLNIQKRNQQISLFQVFNRAIPYIRDNITKSKTLSFDQKAYILSLQNKPNLYLGNTSNTLLAIQILFEARQYKAATRTVSKHLETLSPNSKFLQHEMIYFNNIKTFLTNMVKRQDAGKTVLHRYESFDQSGKATIISIAHLLFTDVDQSHLLKEIESLDITTEELSIAEINKMSNIRAKESARFLLQRFQHKRAKLPQALQFAIDTNKFTDEEIKIIYQGYQGGTRVHHALKEVTQNILGFTSPELAKKGTKTIITNKPGRKDRSSVSKNTVSFDHEEGIATEETIIHESIHLNTPILCSLSGQWRFFAEGIAMWGAQKHEQKNGNANFRYRRSQLDIQKVDYNFFRPTKDTNEEISHERSHYIIGLVAIEMIEATFGEQTVKQLFKSIEHINPKLNYRDKAIAVDELFKDLTGKGSLRWILSAVEQLEKMPVREKTTSTDSPYNYQVNLILDSNIYGAYISGAYSLAQSKTLLHNAQLSFLTYRKRDQVMYASENHLILGYKTLFSPLFFARPSVSAGYSIGKAWHLAAGLQFMGLKSDALSIYPLVNFHYLIPTTNKANDFFSRWE